MSTLLMVLVIFVALFIVLFSGTPIGMGMGFLGVVGILLFLTPNLLSKMAMIAYSQATGVTTLMIPMFILMAEFLANSNIAADLYEVISRRLKRIPANLAIASIVSSAIFSAVCGSAPATAATMGRISIPAMLKRGYSMSLAGGTQAAGGNLGILIPPSINFILFGVITETNIAKLFVAGVFPGIMIAGMMILYVLVRNKIDPNMIVEPVEPICGEAEQGKKFSLLHDIGIVSPVVILIALIFTILYSGVGTATESAAIGAIGSMIIVLLYRRMTKQCLKNTLLNSAQTTCMIMFLMFGGMTFATFLTVQGLPQALSDLIISGNPNPWVTFIVINIIFIILGCFMDPLSIMLIVLPFVFPFVKALGFDPIWFGVVITVNCAIGMITPPVGMNLFVLKGATGIPIKEIIRGVIPYIVIFTIAIVIISIFPQIATFLPANM